MKKILAALLVASFGAGLMAQDYVYDYKASIKRLDPVFAIKTASKAKYVTESYKVVSDTIVGYVIIPKCDNCQGPTASLADTFQYKKENKNYYAKGYFIRKGDKLSKVSTLKVAAGDRAIGAKVPYVLKVPVDGSAAIFGAYYHLQPTTDYTLRTSVKAANKAWMALEYDLPADAVSISSKNVLRNVAEENMTLGFLGLTNDGITKIFDEDGNIIGTKSKVYHTGFGTAVSTYDPADLGWCSDGESSSCQRITSITGTLVGYPSYKGMCGKTPMWDVCYDETRKTPAGAKDVQEVKKSVICGSWTLKYNATMTSNYAKSGEAAITKQLGTELIYQNYGMKKTEFATKYGF